MPHLCDTSKIYVAARRGDNSRGSGKGYLDGFCDYLDPLEWKELTGDDLVLSDHIMRVCGFFQAPRSWKQQLQKKRSEIGWGAHQQIDYNKLPVDMNKVRSTNIVQPVDISHLSPSEILRDTADLPANARSGIPDRMVISAGDYDLGSEGHYPKIGGVSGINADIDTLFTGDLTATIISTLIEDTLANDAYDTNDFLLKFTVGDDWHKGVIDQGIGIHINADIDFFFPCGADTNASRITFEKIRWKRLVATTGTQHIFGNTAVRKDLTVDRCLLDGNGTTCAGIVCGHNFSNTKIISSSFFDGSQHIDVQGSPTSVLVEQCKFINASARAIEADNSGTGYSTAEFKNSDFYGNAVDIANVTNHAVTNCAKDSAGLFGGSTESGTVSSTTSSDYKETTNYRAKEGGKLDGAGATPTEATAYVDGNSIEATVDIGSLAVGAEVTDFIDRKTYQRLVSGNGTPGGVTRDMVVAGTYGNYSPDHVQARVVDFDTEEVVSGFDWTTIDASPSAGTFSGTLSGVPQGGWYKIEVRTRDASNNVLYSDAGSSRWGIGICIAVGGQSNALGSADAAATIANDLASNYRNTQHKHLVDNHIDHTSTAGSCSPALCNELISEYGIPVSITGEAAGGTTLVAGAAVWNARGASTRYQNLIDKIDNGYDGDVEFILWIHGESDADNGSVTEAQYNTNLQSLISDSRTDLGYDVKWLLVPTKNRTASATGSNEIINAFYNADDAASGIYLAASAYDLAVWDGSHYDTPQLDTLGERIANTIKYINGDVANYRGPIAQGASISPRKTVSVVYDRSVTGVNVTGFDVSVSGAERQILRASDTSITLYQDVTETGTLKYMEGADPDESTPLYGNDGLPVEPIIDGLSITADGNNYMIGKIDDTDLLAAIPFASGANGNLTSSRTSGVFPSYPSGYGQDMDILDCTAGEGYNVSGGVSKWINVAASSCRLASTSFSLTVKRGFTVSARVSKKAASAIVFAFRQDSQNYVYLFYNDGSCKVDFVVEQANDYKWARSSAFQIGLPGETADHEIVGQIADDGTLKIFVDGSEVAGYDNQDTVADVTNNMTGSAYVGADQLGTTYYDVDVHQMWLWNRAISASEISTYAALPNDYNLFATENVSGTAELGAIFTTTTDGDIDDGGTYGNTSPGVEGGDYPDLDRGDRVIVASGHILTVPSGVTYSGEIESVIGSSGDPGEVVVAGTWTMGADLLMKAYSNLRVSAGGTLAMGTNNIYYDRSGTQRMGIYFEGTSGNRSTVTASGGTFAYGGSGSNSVIHDVDWRYTDISGVASFLLRPVLASYALYVDNCTIDDCGKLSLDQFDATEDHLILLSKFSAPRDQYIIEMNSSMSGLPSGTRKIEGCVFTTESGDHQLRGKFAGWSINNNRFKNVVQSLISTGSTGSMVWSSNFLAMEYAPTGGRVFSAYPVDSTIRDNVFYFGYDDPAFCTLSNAVTFQDNRFIVEYPLGSTDGGDLFFASSTAPTATRTIQRNIFVFHGDRSTGTPMQSLDLSVASTELFDFKKNTVVGSGGTAYGMLATNEASGVWNGSLDLYSNIAYSNNAAATSKGTVFANADNLDATDFNCFYQIDDRYDANTAITGLTEGDPDFGGSDISADPQFVKDDATLATWDAYVGGPGTSENAIDELLKALDNDFNSAYTASALDTYLETAYTPKNTALQGTGQGGTDIGAVAVDENATLGGGVTSAGSLALGTSSELIVS